MHYFCLEFKRLRGSLDAAVDWRRAPACGTSARQPRTRWSWNPRCWGRSRFRLPHRPPQQNTKSRY
jgi:hypothetical protein